MHLHATIQKTFFDTWRKKQFAPFYLRFGFIRQNIWQILEILLGASSVYKWQEIGEVLKNRIGNFELTQCRYRQERS